MRNLLIATALAAFVLVFWLGVRETRRGGAASAEARGRAKQFATEVAEGVRFRDFQNYGIDLLAFETCRVEKLRRGAVTFGAFNVLVLENVVVNLPQGAPGVAGGIEALDALEEPETVETSTEDFITLFKSVQGLTHIKFSGMRIHGLAVNRCWADGQTARLFSAELAEGGVGIGEHIRVTGCVVYSPDGVGEAAGTARIELKPRPALVYKKDGAEQRLPF